MCKNRNKKSANLWTINNTQINKLKQISVKCSRQLNSWNNLKKNYNIKNYD